MGRGRSSDLLGLGLGFGLGFALGGDSGWGQFGGLLGGGMVRQPLEDFDQVVLGIESLGAAVGQKGVDEGVVRPGFEAAEEHPVFHAQLGGSDHVLDEVGVEFQRSVPEADEDFVPLVEGVVESLGDIAAGEVAPAFREDEAVKLFGDGNKLPGIQSVLS